MPSPLKIEDSHFRSPTVNDLPGKNFGLLIAYVIPGFITLWGLRPLSPTIDGWLTSSAEFPGGMEAIVFVGLASIAAGMAANAARWLISRLDGASAANL